MKLKLIGLVLLLASLANAQQAVNSHSQVRDSGDTAWVNVGFCLTCLSLPMELQAGSNVIGGVTQSGTWAVDVNNFPASVAVTGPLTNTQLRATPFAVDASGSTVPVSGTFWQATQPVSGTFWQATQPVSASGDFSVIQSTGSNLHMVCDSGCTPGGSFADNSAFTASTSPINISGGWYSTSLTNCTDGNACAPQLSLDRKMFVQAFQGGAPWSVSQSGTWNIGSVTTLPAITFASAQPVTQSGSWTITANAGTNLNTSALALDATLTGGTQKTKIVDTGGTNVASVSAAGAVKVDGSAVTQPVSLASTTITGTVAATQSGTWTVQPGNTANTTAWKVDGSAVTQPVSGTVTATQATGSNLHVAVDSAPSTAVTNAGLSNLDVALSTRTKPADQQHAIIDSGTTAVTQATASNLHAAATLDAETTKVIGTVRTLGNAGVALDAATGAAPPANAMLNAGLGSGATGGLLVGVSVGDTYKNINISTATTTLLVTGVSGRQVRITAMHMLTAAANNVAIIEGTGATCGTGTAGLAGGTTADSGYNFAANGGIALSSGFGSVMQTATAGDSICAVTSAATQLSGGMEYAIY